MLILLILLLVVALALLIGGGDMLVRGASALARRLGVTELAIGLTIVAFGTSAPELAVNLLAAIGDRGELSFGNIIGSNIANVGLILGIAALIRPLRIKGQVILREIPMMLLATAVVALMALDPLFRGVPARFDRGEGIIMLLLFGVFIHYTLSEVLRRRKDDAFVEEASRHEGVTKSRGVSLTPSPPHPSGLPASLGKPILLTLAGLILLAVGGQLAVHSAASIAEQLGVPEVIIGLTIIAIGTSLPELATSSMAVVRGETDLAVGNIVGSNIFNLLWIMGLTALARPVPVPPGGWFDLAWMAGLSLLLVPLVRIGTGRRLQRAEGLLLLLLYVFYMAWRVTALGMAQGGT